LLFCCFVTCNICCSVILLFSYFVVKLFCCFIGMLLCCFVGMLFPTFVVLLFATEKGDKHAARLAGFLGSDAVNGFLRFDAFNNEAILATLAIIFNDNLQGTADNINFRDSNIQTQQPL
jgi:hypothetical protein